MGSAVGKSSEWGLEWWLCPLRWALLLPWQGEGSREQGRSPWQGESSRFPCRSDAGRSRVLLEKGLSLLASAGSRTDQATTSCHVKPKKAWIISKGWMKFPYQASFTVALLKPRKVCLCGRTWVLL